MIKGLVGELSKRGIEIYVAEAHAPVREFGQRMGLLEMIRKDHGFPTVDAAGTLHRREQVNTMVMYLGGETAQNISKSEFWRVRYMNNLQSRLVVYLIGAAAIFIILFGIRGSASIINPILLAAVITITVLPIP